MMDLREHASKSWEIDLASRYAKELAEKLECVNRGQGGPLSGKELADRIEVCFQQLAQKLGFSTTKVSA